MLRYAKFENVFGVALWIPYVNCRVVSGRKHSLG